MKDKIINFLIATAGGIMFNVMWMYMFIQYTN